MNKKLITVYPDCGISIFKNNFDTYWPYYIKITKNKLQSWSYDYISAKPYMQMADERF